MSINNQDTWFYITFNQKKEQITITCISKIQGSYFHLVWGGRKMLKNKK